MIKLYLTDERFLAYDNEVKVMDCFPGIIMESDSTKIIPIFKSYIKHKNQGKTLVHDYLVDDYNHIRRVIITYQINKEKINLPGYYECEKVSAKLLKGVFYTVNSHDFKTKLYLCPVALFMFGHYPEYIY